MSFIRAKEIPPGSGNWYDYEVRTVHKGKKVIQEHIRYIGKSGKTTGRRASVAYTRPARQVISELTGSIVTCKHCQSESIRKYGFYNGEQRYWCKECKRKFANDGAIPKMKTPAKQIASAMGMYYGGMPLDAIQQQFKQDYDTDMSESNFWNWVNRFTNEAIKQAKDFKPVVGNTWVADETYMKLGKRNVYFWDIIDADTRFLLATHVSFTRSGRDAKRLMEKAEQRAGKTPKVVVTDKLKSYLVGVEEAFGAYSKHKAGGPFDVESNTNLIERFHGTLEQRTKVFRKYKDLEHIRLLTGGWLINYNYFKQHESLGNIPPAQAMSKTVPFKDWRDVVRDKNVIPETEYAVTKHRNPTAVTLKPLHEGSA
ncbi:transposase [Chloroflexota bacterium]